MMPSVQGYEEGMNLRNNFSKILLEHTPDPPFLNGLCLGQFGGKRGCYRGIRSLLGYTCGFPYVEIFFVEGLKVAFIVF